MNAQRNQNSFDAGKINFLRFSGTKKFGYNDRYIRVEESSQRRSHSKQKVGLRPKIFLPLCKCTVFKFSQEAF